MKGKDIEIIPTIVPTALSNIRDVSGQYASFTSFFQIDVTDGKFAPNITWLPVEDFTLPKEYGYEVHLMVADPTRVGTAFAKAGARRLMAHVEALGDVEKTRAIFETWKKNGVEEIGIALLLQTPLETLRAYLPFADYVLLMTIARIGVQGIPYDPNAPARVAALRKQHPDITIAVDGGVSEGTIEELARAGATRFGVGSAIAKAPDPKAAYEHLQRLAQKAVG